MKILKVRIHRGNYDKGENQMVYPARYIAREVDLNGLGPTSVNGMGAYSGQISHGGTEEHCIIILDDPLADEYAQDPEMEIIDPATADALMEHWRILNGDSEYLVANSNYVITLLAKQTANIPLSQAERRILDPDNPTPGINKRLKLVEDIIANSGQTFTPLPPIPEG